MLVFRDITAQRRMEEELRRTEKLDSLGVLAGGIAHDFNNILTAVIGNVSLARMEVHVGDPLYENLCLVEEAAQQAAALAQYEQGMAAGPPIDAVLLDLTVPGGMGGRETMKRLRELDPEVKGIVSSVYSNDPIMADARRFGFMGVVAKPYNVADLATVVHGVVAGAAD